MAGPTNRPLADAEIGILGDPSVVRTDSAGRFRLGGIRPGQHLVRVRRIGFNAQYLVAQLAPGETREVEIVLEPGAYELPEISVTARTAKPIAYAWTHKYDDFFRRRQLGLGAFITREDIEKRRPMRTANLLVGLSGIRVRYRQPGPSGTDVEFTRCERVSVWIAPPPAAPNAVEARDLVRQVMVVALALRHQ